MRHLLYLMIIAALCMGAGCVFDSDNGKSATEDAGPLVSDGVGETPADAGPSSVDDGEPAMPYVDEEGVLHIEARPMSPGGDDGAGSGGAAVPPGAENITGPVAKNFNAEFVEVRPFDDPDSPWAGMYTDYDHWHYDNFDPGAPFLMSGKPGEVPGELMVNDEGFAEPALVTMRNHLEFIRGSAEIVPGFEKGFKLYARGVMPPELDEQMSLERARLVAQFAPPIPDWLAQLPPMWALILPDGHVATYGRLDSGEGFFPASPAWRRDADAPICHYAPNGRLVKQLEPGRLWCELFFADFEDALALHQVQRGDVQTYDRYVFFQNAADETLSGTYLYDGTPLSEEELAGITDATRQFELYGKYLPEMYNVQQAEGGG